MQSIKRKSIFENTIIKDYEGANPQLIFGYLGHEFRTKERDEYIDNFFKNEAHEYGFTEEDIANWICSRAARHFMDECGTGDLFKSRLASSIRMYKIFCLRK